MSILKIVSAALRRTSARNECGHLQKARASTRDQPTPWAPGYESNRCFSDVPDVYCIVSESETESEVKY